MSSAALALCAVCSSPATPRAHVPPRSYPHTPLISADPNAFTATQPQLLGIYAGVLVVHGLLNTFANRLLALLNGVSVFWHTVGERASGMGCWGFWAFSWALGSLHTRTHQLLPHSHPL